MKHIKTEKEKKRMMYQSKKDETVFAKLVSTDAKYKTSLLEYTTGEKVGQTFSVSDATLKRWWRKSENEADAGDLPVEEILHVNVEDEETGKSVEVDINPADFIPGVDDGEKTYDFNNQDKKYIPMPKIVQEMYMLGKDPYPTVDELMDMLVSWGADIKAYREWIRLFDGTRIIFRRNMRCPQKACIEIRMKAEYIVDGYETLYVPVKSALIKDAPYVIIIKTIEDLEKVIKSLIAATE
jgi:hypothetical protein